MKFYGDQVEKRAGQSVRHGDLMSGPKVKIFVIHLRSALECLRLGNGRILKERVRLYTYSLIRVDEGPGTWQERGALNSVFDLYYEWCNRGASDVPRTELLSNVMG
jgi:hypothetical protein